ncbi:hypothetical protein HHI36_004618 [Cryptolaemus montrouzieri]|uniref:Uncharacterized protein n=1 Tax=Cryptolaemus montrouzieri TaxID=559131 RepID=A0ABD2NSC6_9CUCU
MAISPSYMSRHSYSSATKNYQSKDRMSTEQKRKEAEQKVIMRNVINLASDEDGSDSNSTPNLTEKSEVGDRQQPIVDKKCDDIGENWGCVNKRRQKIKTELLLGVENLLPPVFQLLEQFLLWHTFMSTG